METDPATTDTLKQAMEAHQAGRLREADELYAAVLENMPAHGQALRLRGALARDAGDLGTSARLLGRAVELAPDDAPALRELALTHMAAGRVTDALAALQEALRIEPDSPATLINLGALMHQRGHVQAAIDCYRTALDMEPRDTFVRCNLAKALSDTGDGDAALAACDAAVEHSPGGEQGQILATRGAVLLDRELYSEARTTLEQARATGERDDMLLINAALACYQLGDLAGAAEALEAAHQLNPYNARAVADLANVHCAAGRVPAALQLCEEFLGHYPGERLVIGAYALALHNAGRSADAAQLTDCNHLVQVFDIDCPEGFQSVEDFNAQLTEELLADDSLLVDPVSKSTFGGDQTGELEFSGDDACTAVRQMVENCIPQVVDRLREHGLEHHPVMVPAYQPQSLRAWGTILRAGGRQTSHMHPLGWLSGVYYTRLPAGMSAGSGQAGWLEFNHPPERFYVNQPTPAQCYEPREGRLIVFPSWFWHQTLPFAGDGERVSVAFDVVPTAALRML